MGNKNTIFTEDRRQKTEDRRQKTEANMKSTQ